MTTTNITTSVTTSQTISGDDSLFVVSPGSIITSSTAAVIWSLTAAATTGVTVDNSAIIQATASRAFDTSGAANGAQSFTLINRASGTITSSNTLFREQVSPNGGNITITNSGAMTSTADRAVNIQNEGFGTFTFTNNAGATVTSLNDGLRVTNTPTSFAFTGTINITNSGSISTTGTGANNGQAIDFADVQATTAGHVTVTNNAGGTISAADADAVRASKFFTLNNSGTIQSHSFMGSTGNDGVDFQANTGGTLNNFEGGSIIGARHGVTGDNIVSVTNDGVITGQLGSGLNFDTTTGTMTIVNEVHGVITGTASGVSDGDGIDVDYLVNITNSGTIQALGTSSMDINEGLAIGGGTVTNNVGGLITSVQRAITVDDSNLGNAFGATTITNHGTITGQDGEAIQITDIIGDTITNDGTINGSIVTGNGNDTITDTGTITGALSTRDGNDQISLGSVGVAAIDGGAGTDTISIKNLASATIGGAVTGVETIELGAGSSLSVAASLGNAGIDFGDNSAQHLTVAFAALAAGDLNDLITGLNVGDTIDLRGIGTATSVSVGMSNVLTLSGGTTTASLHLDTVQDLSGLHFNLTGDGAGGTLLTVAGAATSPTSSLTPQDAANFTSEDTLVISNTTITPGMIGVSNNDLLGDVTTLTIGGQSFVFPADSLAHIKFASSFIAGTSQSLFVGTGGDDGAIVVDNDDNGNVTYGLGGNDHMIDGNGANNMFGGSGDDTITGAAGNEHLYGFGLTGDPTTDGADSIFAGAGNDYVQGNAGDDTLGGGDGADRIFGGNGNDHIDGGNGNDSVNGNKGDDSILGGAGNDSLRGGAGNDLIDGGSGNDILLGDDGDDTLIGHAGLDLLTGGAGADVFAFDAGDATFTTTGALAFFTDTITDFQDGTDHIITSANLGLTAADVLHAQAGITLTSVAAALTYAQQLLDAHAGTSDVAVIEVGSDAYLFYNDAGGATIDGMVRLVGVDAAAITTADFLTFPAG